MAKSNRSVSGGGIPMGVGVYRGWRRAVGAAACLVVGRGEWSVRARSQRDP